MSTIPTSLTEKQFEMHVSPHLSKAKRGYVSKIPLYKIFNYILYKLHTGCQWHKIAIERDRDTPEKWEISYDAIYYHFRKWSGDGSLEKVWTGSIETLSEEIDISEVSLDGTHTVAKKGGESVAYQKRKRAKTSNILPLVDAHGYIIASTGIIAGNHNDLFNIRTHLQEAFKHIRLLGMNLMDSYFNADAGFDSRDVRKLCFNRGMIPNIPENKRNRKGTKKGRKRLFDSEVYKRRFVSERSFAWIDKFRHLLTRFDRKDAHFLGAYHIAFAMVNLRNVIA